MKKIDNLGRVVLPKVLREAYNIDRSTDLQVLDSGNGILILPSDKPYTLSPSNMDTLRKLYIMLKESGLLDDEYMAKLSKITKETDAKCDNCKSFMFLMNNNTYKCYKCD